MMMEYQPETELYLYDDGATATYMISEMINLKFKRIARGISLLPDKNADVKTDDVIDCWKVVGDVTVRGELPWR